MAGPFANVTQKRDHELGANRTASLDHAPIITPTATIAKSRTGSAASNSQSAGGIATVAATAIVNNNGRGRIGSPSMNYFRPAHSEIRFGKMRFLVTDRPNERHVKNYVGDLERFRVRNLVRVCEPTYNTKTLNARGITVYDWEFADGSPPPTEIINKWLQLCADEFSQTENCIAIHCVAGLGRAPVLVGIALLEAGMKCDDVVFLIRSQRRGALNEKQLQFMRQYKSAGRLRKFRYNEVSKERNKSCTIM